jgi:hypothetical protein
MDDFPERFHLIQFRLLEQINIGWVSYEQWKDVSHAFGSLKPKIRVWEYRVLVKALFSHGRKNSS